MKELKKLKDSIFDSHPNLNSPKSFLEERLRIWYEDIKDDKDRIESCQKNWVKSKNSL